MNMVTPSFLVRIVAHRFLTSRRTPGILRLVPATTNTRGRDLISEFMTEVMASSSGLCSL